MSSNGRDPKSCLPLTATVFHVLLSLAQGPKHGYAIHREVADRTEGRVALSIGTLYTTLGRLLKEGMVEKAGRQPASLSEDERRLYYRLTSFGQEVAIAELEQMKKSLAVAKEVKLLRKPRAV